MIAPDKIYTDNRGVYAELPIFSQADANVEYIRKDALIEWTNKMLQDTAERFDFRSNQAFAELYSKLNSM
jgi:hypothetical protein